MPTSLRSVLARPWPWMLLLLLVTAALYWPGLRGPSLYDDAQHLALVMNWVDGRLLFRDVVFFNDSVATNRSLAMASLALSGWLGGKSIFAFKLANLLTHLLGGVLVFVVLSKLLRRDRQLGARAQWYAGIVSAIWLLHPLNVSTVLYIVQHMAQVALLCCLLGIWAYAAVRERMLDGRMGQARGVLWLFVSIGLLTFLGIQGKQNAIILPGLCLLVELGWFQKPREWSRGMRLFFICSVALPSLLAVAAVAYFWHSIDAAMLNWDMTTVERLLSQPRVLWDYIRLLVIPYSPSMGLFGDDFVVSRGLLSPFTTLPAILGLVLVSVLAWRARTRAPAIFVGWFWFLVAHSVEAGPAPIELYYEHRNYLPAIGLILMVVGVFVWLRDAALARGLRTDRIGIVLLAGFLLVLCGQTFSRVQVWRYGLSIGMSAFDAHPRSIRAHLAFANALLDARRIGDAYAVYQHLADQPDPQLKAIGLLQLANMNCMVVHDADPALVDQAVALMPDRVNMVTPYVLAHLIGSRATQGCGRLTASHLGDVISSMADKATGQPDESEAKWPMRYNAALAYYQANQLDKALVQARLGWQKRSDPGVALLVVTLMLHADQPDDADAVFWEVMRRAKYSRVEQLNSAGDRAEGLRKMRRYIDDYRAGRGKPPLEGQYRTPPASAAPTTSNAGATSSASAR